MSEFNPLISVIVPTYNSVKWLKYSLGSVLRQTYNNYEIIVVDDGSTDNTKKFIDKNYSENFVRYYYQENRGPSKARNLGLKKAQGDFIAFLDSDDEWFPTKLEKQVHFFNKNPEYKLVLTNAASINEKGEVTGYHYNYFPEDREQIIIRFYLQKIWRVTSTIMVSTEVANEIGGFRVDFPHREEYYFIMQVADKYPVALLEECLSKKRARSDSFGSGGYKDPEKSRALIKPFIDKAPGKFPFLKKYKRFQLSQFYFGIALNYVDLTDKKKAYHYLSKAIKNNPLHMEAIILFIFMTFSTNKNKYDSFINYLDPVLSRGNRLLEKLKLSY